MTYALIHPTDTVPLDRIVRAALELAGPEHVHVVPGAGSRAVQVPARLHHAIAQAAGVMPSPPAPPTPDTPDVKAPAPASAPTRPSARTPGRTPGRAGDAAARPDGPVPARKTPTTRRSGTSRKED